MPWQKPENYQPRDDLKNYLENLSPRMNTPEFDMVVYWQWVHRSLNKYKRTPAKAWTDLRMTPEHARAAIGKQIVPPEIYDLAAARAAEEEEALVG